MLVLSQMSLSGIVCQTFKVLELLCILDIVGTQEKSTFFVFFMLRLK